MPKRCSMVSFWRASARACACPPAPALCGQHAQPTRRNVHSGRLSSTPPPPVATPPSMPHETLASVHPLHSWSHLGNPGKATLSPCSSLHRHLPNNNLRFVIQARRLLRLNNLLQ